ALNIQNTAELRAASPDYFSAMGIPLLQGRSFEQSDGGTSTEVVVVNQSLAAWLFPDEAPLGRRLVVQLDTAHAMVIVGVVGDVHQYALGAPPRAEFYLPASFAVPRSVHLVVKGARGVPSANTVREAVRRADPRQPLTRALVLEELVDGTLSSGRLQAVLMGLFAVLAAALAAVGLYGVLAQTVADRRREIGVRLAMGAEPRMVVRMVVRQGTGMAVVGLAVGAVLALVLARLLTSMLFGIAPWDPVAFVATPVVLAGVATVASWIPARRAARTDPVEALRAQ
ncbi:MAG TPA: FtsX-like permease family protein, partial [Longimicrobiales bacterium]|nr:FtsX-like permease family protein [Longimicrobiales bacterium]